MENIKLKTIKQLTGNIVLKTGLHIGAGDTELHIGGADSTVVKHPKTLKPYIPGSSLKGKIRSLLELYLGLINFTKDGKPVSLTTLSDLKNNPTNLEMAKNILKLFGAGASSDTTDDTSGILTSRLSFYDCNISKECENEILTEVKAENTINRINSMATNPRFFERVPQGIKFDFCLSIKEFEGDGEELLILLKKGLRLLEFDSLGGSGSRGYGKIKFENLKLDGIDFILPEKLS